MKRLILVIALGCSSKEEAKPAPTPVPAAPTQSVKDAMELICSIPSLPVSAIADVTMRQAEINKWFKANVKNPDAIKTYLQIATVAPAERRTYIHDAAKAAGVAHCALAAFYNPAPVSVPVPQ